MKKVLITGSAGFIAPHIVEECLSKNWQVICVDFLEVKNKNKSKNIVYLKKDVRD